MVEVMIVISKIKVQKAPELLIWSSSLCLSLFLGKPAAMERPPWRWSKPESPSLAALEFLTYRNCEVTGLCCSELVSMRGQEAQWQVIGTKGNVFHVGVHVTPAAQPDQHFLSISFFLEKTATEYHRA